MPLVIMRHCRVAALLHRQAGLGAVERLDLRFLIDRQHNRMRRRIDIKADNIAQLLDKLPIRRQLELAHAMRLQPVRAPDPLHRTDADPDLLGHHRRRPVGRLTWRIAQRLRHRLRAHRSRQRRDARRTGLVAQQPVEPLRHETLLPAPYRDLALPRLAHDRVGPDTVCGHQHDARPPTMLLRTVPIGDDRRQSPRSALLTGTAIPWRMLVPPRRTASEHTLIGDSYIRFYLTFCGRSRASAALSTQLRPTIALNSHWGGRLHWCRTCRNILP